MKNTQSFNTQLGIKKIRNFYRKFKEAQRNNDKRGMAVNYDGIANSCSLFPPCSVVSSLRNDVDDLQIQNILPDVKVIEDAQDKIKY